MGDMEASTACWAIADALRWARGDAGTQLETTIASVNRIEAELDLKMAAATKAQAN